MITREEVLAEMVKLGMLEHVGHVVWRVELGSEVDAGQATGWGYAYEDLEYPGGTKVSNNSWFFYERYDK